MKVPKGSECSEISHLTAHCLAWPCFLGMPDADEGTSSRDVSAMTTEAIEVTYITMECSIMSMWKDIFGSLFNELVVECCGRV